MQSRQKSRGPQRAQFWMVVSRMHVPMMSSWQPCAHAEQLEEAWSQSMQPSEHEEFAITSMREPRRRSRVNFMRFVRNSLFYNLVEANQNITCGSSSLREIKSKLQVAHSPSSSSFRSCIQLGITFSFSVNSMGSLILLQKWSRIVSFRISMGLFIEQFYQITSVGSMIKARLSVYREHHNILKNHEFLSENLKGDKLLRFKEMMEKIGIVMDYNFNYSKEKITLESRVKDMLIILSSSIKESSLTKTFKKIAILHIFIRKAATSGLFDQPLARCCFDELEKLKNGDFKKLRKDWSGGIGQLCHFFKQFGKPSNPHSIQHQSSNGAVREIVERIYYPFYLYLLKVAQDRQIYSAFLQKKASYDPFLLWKMVNLSKQLGLIVAELNRICRYFKNQLSGIYFHFAYLISLDMNAYYDCLRDAINGQCELWRMVIRHIQSLRKENYEEYLLKYEEMVQDSSFIELQRFVEQLSSIREDLIWIYMNKQLKSCLKHFGRPINGVSIEINPSTSHITFIQSFLEKKNLPSLHAKNRKRKISIDINDCGVIMGNKEQEMVEISTGLSIAQAHFDEEV